MDRDRSAGWDLVSVVERARRMGPLPYSALGRRGVWRRRPTDAVAAWFARSIDTWWAQAGEPDPFTVVDVGAGDASLAGAIVDRELACRRALRYVLVEPDGMEPGFSARAVLHGRLLPIESPSMLFPPGADDPDDPGEPAPPASGIGPLVTSLSDIPVVEGVAVLLAYGWMSRLPFDIVEWHADDWWEVRLAAGPLIGGTGLVEVLVPLDPERAVAHLPLAVDEGARCGLLTGATEWLAATLRSAESGVVAVCGNWTATTEPFNPAGGPALALDQLARVRRPIENAPIQLPWGEALVTWRLG